MSAIQPKSNSLGVKHRHCNELVKDAIANNIIEVHLENQDLEILAKIEIASNNRDLEFLLNILKSDDLLHVSRAIKKSTWLITDNDYAHIINPDYLHKYLFPDMTSKSRHKLLKHVRNNIKDEERAEKFYKSEDSVDAALKWLPKCSVPFIEAEVVTHYDSIKKSRLFKRLCERSINILNVTKDKRLTRDKIDAVKFVQKKDTSMFLNALDRLPSYDKLKLNKKTTKILMTNCPDQIVENFNKYCEYLDIKTFSKYLQPENVKDFIYKLVGLGDTFQQRYIFSPERFQYFVQRMPEQEIFDFINAVFINQVHKSQSGIIPTDSEVLQMKKLYSLFHCPLYEWYKFAPFEVAFDAIKHQSSKEELDYLMMLVKRYNDNSHLQSLLKYYCDKHIKDSQMSIISFIRELLSENNFCYYDDSTWSILNYIFETIGVYSESNDNFDRYIEIVIVHKLIKNEPIEEQLEKKFVFSNTLIDYSKHIQQDEKMRIFHFIFHHVFRMTESINNIENEEQLMMMTNTLKNVLYVLNDWSKDLINYPNVLSKIQELVKIKTEKSWKTDLSSLYNINKSWKKLMFKESLHLELSEKVCINALKHDPELLERHHDKVDFLICDSKRHLRQFLRKVRIYNSTFIAQKLINSNLQRLKQTNNDHSVIFRNLCTLMPLEDILKVIIEYIPENAKINWDKEDGSMFGIRRHIAKNMHFSRPHPSPDMILAYAKGDYLQYSIPSLLAIFYNLKSTTFQQYVHKLFNAPVSLQKIGIRLAVTKLQHRDLVAEFHNLWTNTKNITIRTVIFQLTYKLLCRQKDEYKIEKLWNLLKMFIENLTIKEDKTVYSLMYKTECIPDIIKANFIETCYIFFESYLTQIESDVDEFERFNMEEKLILNSTNVIEKMNDEFMVRILSKLIDLKFFSKSPHAKQSRRHYINPCDGIISVLSIYLLSSKDEKEQKHKYKCLLLPILQRALGKLNDEYRWKENIKSLLDYLRIHLKKYVLDRNFIIPLKMFKDINKELMNSLKISEYYILLTQWKLTVEYVEHLHRTSSDVENGPDTFSLQTEYFGQKCLEILKGDVEKHFSRIYLVFHKALYEVVKNLCIKDEIIQIYKSMLGDKEFIPGYLTIIKISTISYDRDGSWDEIVHELEGHPSKEVKMHYSFYFKEYATRVI